MVQRKQLIFRLPCSRSKAHTYNTIWQHLFVVLIITGKTAERKSLLDVTHVTLKKNCLCVTKVCKHIYLLQGIPIKISYKKRKQKTHLFFSTTVGHFEFKWCKNQWSLIPGPKNLDLLIFTTFTNTSTIKQKLFMRIFFEHIVMCDFYVIRCDLAPKRLSYAQPQFVTFLKATWKRSQI